MLHPDQVEELVCLVASMDRETLTDQFLHFHGTFPTDFTPEFLSALSLDRMRHVFVALCMQSSQMPAVMAETGA